MRKILGLVAVSFCLAFVAVGQNDTAEEQSGPVFMDPQANTTDIDQIEASQNDVIKNQSGPALMDTQANADGIGQTGATQDKFIGNDSSLTESQLSNTAGSGQISGNMSQNSQINQSVVVYQNTTVIQQNTQILAPGLEMRFPRGLTQVEVNNAVAVNYYVSGQDLRYSASRKMHKSLNLELKAIPGYAVFVHENPALIKVYSMPFGCGLDIVVYRVYAYQSSGKWVYWTYRRFATGEFETFTWTSTYSPDVIKLVNIDIGAKKAIVFYS